MPPALSLSPAFAAPIAVQVINDVTQSGSSGLEVHAYERLADGGKVWKAKRTTDGAGNADKILTEAGPVTVFDPGFPLHWHVEA